MTNATQEPPRLLLTPEEAESLLPDGCEYVHNMTAGGMMVIGCDWSREEAVVAFREAASLEIAGPTAKAMQHPIAMTQKSGRQSFFSADMDKVEAFERQRATA